MNRVVRVVAVMVGLVAAGVFALAGTGPVAANPAQLTARGLYKVKGAPATLPPTQLAGFAAGCFWGVEEEFRKQKGVVATAVGFSGGHVVDPGYRRVCSGDTGHAETVYVEYDPKAVSYEQLLALFWDLHDPTTLNRQGPDEGEQYRSVIFFFDAQQKAAALASRDKLQKSGEVPGKIVTEIVPAVPFYKAEEYHQQYVEKGGRAGCHRRKGVSL